MQQSILVKKRLKQLALVILALIVVVFGVNEFQAWNIRQEQIRFEKADKKEFIEIVGKTAQPLAAEQDLYASVMVAQAILESDWGNSKLTKEANNLFGIKGEYQGQSYRIETHEDDGTGKLHVIVAEFRKYPTYHISLQDNAALLKGGVSWDPEYYALTWRSRTKSYKDATAHLQGRYATDTKYAGKLNELIEQYDLTRFDKK